MTEKMYQNWGVHIFSRFPWKGYCFEVNYCIPPASSIIDQDGQRLGICTHMQMYTHTRHARARAHTTFSHLSACTYAFTHTQNAHTTHTYHHPTTHTHTHTHTHTTHKHTNNIYIALEETCSRAWSLDIGSSFPQLAQGPHFWERNSCNTRTNKQYTYTYCL